MILFDKLASFFALILLAPIFLIIAILIKIDSKGPVFFKQIRVGKNLIPFKIFKFRSMTHSLTRYNGETNIATNLDEMRKQRQNFLTTSTNDSRITKMGAFIRRTSLDEIPQILNVLIGDMSLVGPRPDTPIQEVDYNPEQWVKRHTIKPGITGLAQIKGRSLLTTEDRINADLEYVKNRSLKLYFKIIFTTFYQVIAKKDAN